eukprot:68191-Pelagomonas_calceolata.AAC.5
MCDACVSVSLLPFQLQRAVSMQIISLVRTKLYHSVSLSMFSSNKANMKLCSQAWLWHQETCTADLSTLEQKRKTTQAEQLALMPHKHEHLKQLQSKCPPPELQLFASEVLPDLLGRAIQAVLLGSAIQVLPAHLGSRP